MFLTVPTKKRVLVIIMVTFVTIIGAGYFIATLRTDVIATDKTAFLEMLIALSSASIELTHQLNSISNHPESKLNIAVLRSKLPLPTSDRRRLYWVTPNGELLAIDFANRIFVSLSPMIGVSQPIIGCSGYPKSAVPASCITTTTTP